MKQIIQLTMAFVLLGSLAAGPVLSQDQGKQGPGPSERKAGKQKKMDSTGKMDMDHMEGMGKMEGMENGMMGGSMMSRQSDMILMMNTMSEMAQMLKEQAKDPDAKAKTDQMIANIEKMKERHQMKMKMRMEMMEMMMEMMDTMMPEHGGASSKK